MDGHNGGAISNLEIIMKQQSLHRIAFGAGICRASLVLAVIAMVLLPGCTTLPTREFGSYRAAFHEARVAGEKVLLDYSAALKDYERINAEKAKSEAAEKKTDRPVWSRAKVQEEALEADVIAVRLRAWSLVGAYNEALSALAEGKPAKELGTSFDGLVDSLESFPWDKAGDKFASLASSVGGFVGPAVEIVRDLIVEAKREQDRRKFLAAIQEGAPLVHGLIALLEADADDFYSTRYAIFDHVYGKGITRRVGTLARTAQQIVISGGKPDENAAEAIARLNMALGRILQYRDGSLRVSPSGGPTNYSEQMLRDLASLTVQVESEAQKATEMELRMDDYEALLSEYVRMLVKLDQSLRKLQTAAANPEVAAPDVGDLAALAIRVKRAIAAYEQPR